MKSILYSSLIVQLLFIQSIQSDQFVCGLIDEDQRVDCFPETWAEQNTCEAR